jgi:hypothetical protein
MKTVIDGFKVELEDSECFIESGAYSSSLAVLEDFGHLEGSRGDLKVAQKTIDKISKWACDNGY